MKKILLVLVLVCAALLAGFALWHFYLQPAGLKKTAQPKASPTPAPTPTEADKIQEMIAAMPLEKKIGQLFLARVPQVNQVEDVRDYHLGGYLMFARDFQGETTETVAAKIAGYQSASEIPLLIGVDEEGGEVTRLWYGQGILAPPFASPSQLYAQGGLDLVRQDTANKAEILKACGINYNLAPVADVAQDPESFIYDRTVGLDAAGTSEYVTTVVSEMKKDGVASCLKHFPGYGDNKDSHGEMVWDTRPMQSFEETDLLPFKAGIAAGADSVLVAHNIVAAFDPDYPASLSEKVHAYLRKELGFEGVAVTDDFEMAGLRNFADVNTAALLTLKAGSDLIISSYYKDQIPFLMDAGATGQLPEDVVDEHLRRVLQMKVNLGLIIL
ncbi:MAG: glycoside hydrolase family 3 N-terminal domain-containing protein [Eubacterium sp.]|nr:glycoside hydrolase family 3 N-terminal domain-containing protein [Eubacterium sp.]